MTSFHWRDVIQSHYLYLVVNTPMLFPNNITMKIFLVCTLLLFLSYSDALYLRVIEAGSGKRVGLPLSDGFVICPKKFGQMTIECVTNDSKYADISVNGVMRREWNKPFTYKGDFPGAIQPWKPTLGKTKLKCVAFAKNKLSSVEISGNVDCPKGLEYIRNATHVDMVMKKKVKVSPNPSPSPTPKHKMKKAPPSSKDKKKKPSPTMKEPVPITKGMRLRLVHAGYKGDKKTVSVLKNGFKIKDVKDKSIVCDAPAAKQVTFYVNGVKWRVETVRPFSIDGDVGEKILKWKKVPRGKVTVLCVCTSGMKVSAMGTIM